MGLQGTSIIFLLLCQLGGSCRAGSCRFEKPRHSDGVSGPAQPPRATSGASWGPRNLSCYRVSGGAEYECVWQFEGSEDNVTHFLRCCFGGGRCCYFPAGRSKTVQFSEQAGVPVLSKVTFWVESRLSNWTLKSPEISLYLFNWNKLDPPRGSIKVSHSEGQLRLDWNVSDTVQAEVQFRHRTHTTNWTLGDCGPQDNSGVGVTEDGHRSSSESCFCPLKNMAQEFQIRRRRLLSGAPGGPWSVWSDPVCVPPEPVPQPQVKFQMEQQLDRGGRRRVTLRGQAMGSHGECESRGGAAFLGSADCALHPQAHLLHTQSPQPAVPEGCQGVLPGARVKYLVRVRMLSCTCQLQTFKTVSLGKALSLSGAAYDLVLVTKTRFGRSPSQTWHLPAHNLTELRTLNVSVDGNVTSVHWAAQAPDATYCVEWQARTPKRSHTQCALIAPEDRDQGRTVTHRWSAEPARAPEGCYRVTVFASKNPENPLSWATVLSSYYFRGDASAAGTPSLVSVRNRSGDSVSVEWEPSRLSDCPGVLTRYVVRCEAKDGEWASEWLVPPDETRATLRGLRSGLSYRVLVRADTARLPGAWSLPLSFSFERQVSRLSIILASLGSFASVLLVGGLGYVGLRRVAWRLCPPLPTPCASSAVEFPGGQDKRAWQWHSPEDFPEVVCPRGTLVVEVADDRAGSPQAAPARPALEPEIQANGCSEAHGGPAHERLPLLLGDVTRGAATSGDLWWTQKRTEEPGPSTRPLVQDS